MISAALSTILLGLGKRCLPQYSSNGRKVRQIGTATFSFRRHSIAGTVPPNRKHSFRIPLTVKRGGYLLVIMRLCFVFKLDRNTVN